MHGRRRAFSLLEIQVAFVLLGLAIAGLGPLAVMQWRQIERLDRRLPTGRISYLIPSTQPWARKFGAAATLTTTEPSGAPSGGNESPANSVSVEQFTAAVGTDTATATVTLTPIHGNSDFGHSQGKSTP